MRTRLAAMVGLSRALELAGQMQLLPASVEHGGGE